MNKVCILLLIQVSAVFLQESEVLVNFKKIWSRIPREIFVEHDLSKIVFKPDKYILITSNGTTLGGYKEADVDNRIASTEINGEKYVAFNVTIDTIAGSVEHFGYTLSYHPDEQQNASATYTITGYTFRVFCTIWPYQGCLNKCTQTTAISNGKFNTQFNYYGQGGSFPEGTLEKRHLDRGFKSTEVYLINKHLGQIILDALNQVNNEED